ncbi:unnamed protein product [marine sediment metagenome]|uniref:Uncharacterized protein n=1 Tax=marine sediment metagenome TaxID=412755 RepID=X1KE63_9ZZZZ
MLATFITIESADITAMIGYISDFLTDLTPLLLPIVAVGVGIFVFWAIVKAIKS